MRVNIVPSTLPSPLIGEGRPALSEVEGVRVKSRLKYQRLPLHAEDAAQSIADFPYRGVSLDAADESRHGVFLVLGGHLFQVFQSRGDLSSIALFLDLFQCGNLLLRFRRVDADDVP